MSRLKLLPRCLFKSFAHLIACLTTAGVSELLVIREANRFAHAVTLADPGCRMDSCCADEMRSTSESIFNIAATELWCVMLTELREGLSADCPLACSNY